MRSEKKAVFAGDFDPFTIRDAQFILKSLKVVDKVLVYVSDHKTCKNTCKANLELRRKIIQKWIELNKKSLGDTVQVYAGELKSAELQAGKDKKYVGFEYKICSSRYLNKSDLNPAHFETFHAAKYLIVIVQPDHPISSDAEKYFNQQNIGLIKVESKNIKEVNAGHILAKIREHISQKRHAPEELDGLVSKGLENMIYEGYRTALTT